MTQISLDDRLEILGLLAGAFVVLGALGSLVGQPWSTAGGSAVAAVQVLGILLTIAVGVLVVLITQGYDLSELR